MRVWSKIALFYGLALAILFFCFVRVSISVGFEKLSGDVDVALIAEIEAEHPITESEKEQVFKIKLWRYLLYGPSSIHENKMTYQMEKNGVVLRIHEVSFPERGSMYNSSLFTKVNGKWKRENIHFAMETY